MMSKTSLAFFNEPVLRGWCGFWIAPQPHRLGGPQARITRVVSTGDFSWPHAGTFTWPRTSAASVVVKKAWNRQSVSLGVMRTTAYAAVDPTPYDTQTNVS